MITGICRVKGLAVALCVGSIVISCGKKDPEPETPSFRLFVKGREITDASTKASFLKRSADKFPAVGAVGPNDKIVFVAPDTALFGTLTSRFSVVRSGTQHLFYSPQQVLGSNKDRLIRDLQKYVAPEVPLNWRDYNYLTQEVRVGYGDAKQMRVHYLQYYWIKSNWGGATGMLFNEVNEAVASKIPSADTLAVQTGSVMLPVQ